ncbi:hypothetical protein DMC47_44550 [Nostoc sp. 3335mG]|nr:hypothetical protein DMC47_44550 [Nostoc sp. 3335mG]
MRKVAFAVLVATTGLLAACHQQPSFNYTSEDANEDAALNNIESEEQDAKGAGLAVSGLIPDANGTLPEANVQ